jgi:superfamily I DNA and/or RNA helicase
VGKPNLEELGSFYRDLPANETRRQHQRGILPSGKALLESIRLATVDNFPGEEPNVKIISVVKRNDANKYGSLSTPNRINVLLSRALHGMYLIGNANTY